MEINIPQEIAIGFFFALGFMPPCIALEYLVKQIPAYRRYRATQASKVLREAKAKKDGKRPDRQVTGGDQPKVDRGMDEQPLSSVPTGGTVSAGSSDLDVL